jgi:hypothetical protein
MEALIKLWNLKTLIDHLNKQGGLKKHGRWLIKENTCHGLNQLAYLHLHNFQDGKPL